MTIRARRILRISFTVANLGRTEAFYARLGFVAVAAENLDDTKLALLGLPASRAERVVMRLGAQEVEFLRFDPPGRPYPENSTSTDGWFQHVAIVVDDMASAFERVVRAGATPITQGPPQHLPPNTGQVTAFKFRDPDGHPLELLAFPPGVGDPVWHRGIGSSPFLGIDHTAIVVADAFSSQGFYMTLGFVPSARSFNRGPAQTRLDDVPEDRVDVMALTLPHTPPHLELLAYKTGIRRPMFLDTIADDIIATRIIVEADVLSDADQPGVVLMFDNSLAILAKDPDGHALVFQEHL